MAGNVHKENATAKQLSADRSYERRDVSTRGLAWFAFWFITGSIFLHLAVALIFKGMVSKRSVAFPAETPDVHLNAVPGPRLQSSPQEELEQFRSREEQMLNTYGWVDREHGVVRIPIARAMELIAKEGLPVRAGAEKQDKKEADR